MEKYEKAMEPIARALDALQGEINNSQGYIIPVLQSMKMRILSIDESNNLVRDFKRTLEKQIDARFGHYFEFNENNKELLLAAISHPRFKNKFISRENDEIYVKNILMQECKKMNRDVEVVIQSSQNEPVSNQDDFIITFASDNNARRMSLDNQIENEVTNYLLDPNEKIDMLNDYKNIKNVFFRYNTTLSSSAPVERVFNQSKMIFTPMRNRISSKHFEMMMMLKHNRVLIDENYQKVKRYTKKTVDN